MLLSFARGRWERLLGVSQVGPGLDPASHHRDHPRRHITRPPAIQALGLSRIEAKLLGPAKWTYYYLYVIIGIFSRYVTGWVVATRESAVRQWSATVMPPRTGRGEDGCTRTGRSARHGDSPPPR